MIKSVKRGDFIKINSNLGYGDRMFKVADINVNTKELTLSVDGKRVTLYQAHCYQTLDTIKLSNAARSKKGD